MSEPLEIPPLQNMLEGKTLKEVVLYLFGTQTDAGTIMSLCKISEAELEEILPLSLWTGIKLIPCPRCGGRGNFSKVVPWEQDEIHRSADEAA